jgi:branched-chain amino acid transport system substrate-binding protein
MTRSGKNHIRSTLGLTGMIVAAVIAGTAHAQSPIRIGVSISTTGAYAAIGQNALRGTKLCVKKTNDEGGLLGRKLDLAVEDDASQPGKAVSIYEKFLTKDKVDAILSPYSSPITDAVADVVEKYRMPLVSCCAATTAIFRKGRKFVFMFTSPAEVYLDGVIDIALKRGLKTLAVIHEDTLLPKAISDGAVAMARKKGLQVVLVQSYPRGAKEFRPILRKVSELNPDVLAAPGYFDDAVSIVQQMKELNVNPRMFAVTSGGDLPKFQQVLGKAAEFVYVPTKWVPELMTLRAGGIVPIARQYPGAAEFVAAHHKEFPGAEMSYQTAEAYGACQVFTEAVRRAGSLAADRIRDSIVKLDINTAFGAFKVDQDGVQIAHRMILFQWQDGKKAIVWPEELAVDKPKFPMPAWSNRP